MLLYCACMAQINELFIQNPFPTLLLTTWKSSSFFRHLNQGAYCGWSKSVAGQSQPDIHIPTPRNWFAHRLFMTLANEMWEVCWMPLGYTHKKKNTRKKSLILTMGSVMSFTAVWECVYGHVCICEKQTKKKQREENRYWEMRHIERNTFVKGKTTNTWERYRKPLPPLQKKLCQYYLSLKFREKAVLLCAALRIFKD